MWCKYSVEQLEDISLHVIEIDARKLRLHVFLVQNWAMGSVLWDEKVTKFISGKGSTCELYSQFKGVLVLVISGG
jgi:hypothetical protein